jgi:hypothetical protein
MNPASLVVLKIVVIASEHGALCASSPSLKGALEKESNVEIFERSS